MAPGTSEALNGRAPSDPGAGWLNTGLSNENGNPTAAYVATVTGMVADAVVQVVKPDVGKYWTNSGGAMISNRLSTKYPLATPIINEAANNFNGSGLSKSMQGFINSSWARIANQPEDK
ncbi:hypothetical protein [Burkholderia gladioli]|uniref:hypothetical protein n=1 Tax=Burkholderia gladioli TaxID=28095 RepID=UPI00163E50FF|nr:hypothetical protein [Burkholderia gladioli]URV29256.1 hypothetical protein NAL90_24085 [Burkholderia gladioli]